MLCTPAPRQRPGLRLVCFPPEGGSARFFRLWPQDLPDTVELAAVQYPGHGDRAGEPPCGQVDDLVQPLAKELAERPEPPLALFGHGLGAVLAFETARLLTTDQKVAPRALFVSHHPAPANGAGPAAPPYDDDPVARLHRLNGEDGAGEGVPAATVYADLRLTERYRPLPGPPLRCPVTALVGLHDPRITPGQADGWRHCTTGPFTLRAIPGGPGFAVQRRAALVAFLRTSLSGIGSSECRPPLPSH